MKRIHLRTLRESKGFTQEQLEAETERRGTKVPQGTISRLENDADVRPVFDTVASLADALDVDPRVIKFGPDPKRSEAA